MSRVNPRSADRGEECGFRDKLTGLCSKVKQPKLIRYGSDSLDFSGSDSLDTHVTTFHLLADFTCGREEKKKHALSNRPASGVKLHVRCIYIPHIPPFLPKPKGTYVSIQLRNTFVEMGTYIFLTVTHVRKHTLVLQRSTLTTSRSSLLSARNSFILT